MTYATVTRGHDAEWYLHHERVTNDRMMATARTYGAPRRSRAEHIAMVPPPEPDELSAARRVVHRIAGRLGADADDVRDVMDALGLTPPPPTPTEQPAEPRRTKGFCPWCERTVALRADQTMQAHTRSKHNPAGAPRCPGTHTDPRLETTP
jgi:hypothetical protein